MANPVLSQSTIEQARTSWAPPPVHRSNLPAPQPGGAVGDGPISPWSGSVMTIGGTIAKSVFLLTLTVISAAVAWSMTNPVTVDESGQVSYGMPPFAMIGTLVGVGLVFLLFFKPTLAKWIAPLYAIVEGVVVGSVSKYYDAAFNGIVLQAVGATVAVFAVVLALYASRLIQVTQRLRSVIVSATIGIMVMYGVSFLLSLFGVRIDFFNQPNLLGIGISVVVSLVAAANLLLDFDVIERGARARLDKGFEWYAAFGLLVTIIWLYLELLRLLAKLNRR